MENQLRKITFKKIEYYLYNYDYIDIRIDNIRMDINSLDYNQNYTKYIKNKSSSLEDQVIRNIDIEKRIYKLKRWKNLITFVLKKYRKTDILKYNFIDLKYFRKVSPNIIQKELGLNFRERMNICNEILQYISFLAIKKGMLREVNFY